MALAIALLGPQVGSASSHREAPLTAADPQVDTTDLYAFVSPDDPANVTLIANWIPFEEPAGGPNFYQFADRTRYEINVSNDGDASPEITYRWVFKTHYRNPNTFLYATGPVTSLNDENLNIYQTYNLKKKVPGKPATTLKRNVPVAPSDVGAASMPDYKSLSEEAVKPVGATGKTFAGQADDPFFLDLRVFDLLYGGDFSEAGDDTLQGFNVNSLALSVPKTELAKGNDPAAHDVIGVWSTTSRRSTRVQTNTGSSTYKGSFVRVSRLGQPLVNEVVVPVGSKDYFNGSKPENDEQFLGAVNDPELPHLIEAVYGIPAPDSDDNKAGIQRYDLISVFLTGIDGLNQPKNVEPSEMLRLNLNTAPCEEGTCNDYSRLGVIGGDNAANDAAFRTAFPYVSLPTRGSDAKPHQ
ncbi:MAG: DUF4331 domain-containing protein [Actinobacteria bacterium]|nr:DUF4331 domain-containing protein [Actinomycetota bacterium]